MYASFKDIHVNGDIQEHASVCVGCATLQALPQILWALLTFGVPTLLLPGGRIQPFLLFTHLLVGWCHG